ncbi:tetratricopeptide repeat-containing sensor histidine kinase [Parapedobacter koreensis]|nr:ATP-binding protein [Parapedobacter koreensis]
MAHNNRIIGLCLLLAGINYQALAQQATPHNQYTDSVLTVIRSITDKDKKFTSYLDLSLYWSEIDTTQAYRFIDEAEKLLPDRPSDFQKGLIQLYTANVIFHHDIERARKAYMHADKLLSTYKTPTSYKYLSKVWNNYGILYQLADRPEAYMQVIIGKVIPYARLAGDSLAAANGLTNIGLLLTNKLLYDEADRYFSQAIHALKHSEGDKRNLFTAYIYAANAAVLGGHLQKSRHYLDDASTLSKSVPHAIDIPYYYRTEGRYYRHIKEYDTARDYLLKAIELGKTGYDDKAIRDSYYELFQTYRDEGNYSEAKKMLSQSNQYNAGVIGSDTLLHLREMADIDYKLGNYSVAFEQMQRYALAKDSLYRADQTNEIIALEKRFETLEKENEILRLQDANQKQRLALDKNRMWAILSTSLGILALVVAFFLWKLTRANRKRLIQKEQLHQQKLQSVAQKERLNQYQTILQVQEEERNRIARDLHDGLGGLLAGIKLRLSTLNARSLSVASQAEEEQDMSLIIGDLNQASNELRRIARNMMPEALLDIGLEHALSDLCQFLASSRTRILFQGLDLKQTYVNRVMINVYRIVQELLNNALKHADASQIIVQCSDEQDHLFLTVEDDGKGFDTLNLKSKGIGLKSIENRVALLNGRMEIDSQLRRGTTISIEIPL